MSTTKSIWVDYRQLKARVNVAQVMALFGHELSESDSSQHYSPCPLPDHDGDGDNPHAFSLSREKNCWRCFTSCGSGNVIDLFARFTKRDPTNPQQFRAAAVDLHQRLFGDEASTSSTASGPFASKNGDEVTSDVVQETFLSEKEQSSGTAPYNSEVEVDADDTPADSDEDEASTSEDPTSNLPLTFTLNLKSDVPFLTKEKNFPDELMRLFEIGWVNTGMMSGRVVVPIHNEDGDLVAYAGRGLKKEDILARGRWLFPKRFKKSFELFNQHRAVELDIASQGLVVVEGFWSAIRWHQAGVPAVALMGSEISDHQVQRIAQITNQVWLMLDADKAGKTNRGKVAAKLGEHVGIRVVKYPEDSHLQPERFTPEELLELLPS